METAFAAMTMRIVRFARNATSFAPSEEIR
jgi:hypothetical protein